MLKQLMTMPFQIASEMGKVATAMVDTATGGRNIHIDNTETIPGRSASSWANEFERDPSRLSPVSVGGQRQGRTHSGHPFPGGPKVEITVTDRRDTKLADGRGQTVLELQYGGDYRGPGRMTVTEREGGGLTWRDEWKGVENRSHVPARAAEMGHPVVAKLGASGIGRSSYRR